jgi:hypothetical protein
MWCAAPAALKVGTMNELIALAKQRNAEGQPLSFGSGGNGTTAHLGAEVLKHRGTSQDHDGRADANALT